MSNAQFLFIIINFLSTLVNIKQQQTELQKDKKKKIKPTIERGEGVGKENAVKMRSDYGPTCH